jgi:hypothetical protein
MAKKAVRTGFAPSFDAAKARLSRNPDGTLDLRCGARVFRKVRIKLGRPLYKPGDFASVLGEKGEVALLVNLSSLTPGSRAVIEEHRVRNDLTTKILKINDISHQFGAAFWDVVTEKGARQFVIRGTSEHVRWLDDDRLLITDVNGNRFELPSIIRLDKRSQDHIHLIL